MSYKFGRTHLFPGTEPILNRQPNQFKVFLTVTGIVSFIGYYQYNR